MKKKVYVTSNADLPVHNAHCGEKVVKTKVILDPLAMDVNTGEYLNESNQIVEVDGPDFNLDEFIQSHVSECDIHELLAQLGYDKCKELYADDGKHFIDSTGVGHDVKSAIDGYAQAKANYEKLDPAIRALVDNGTLSAETLQQVVQDLAKKAVEEKIQATATEPAAAQTTSEEGAK